MNEIQPIAGEIPYMTIPGNHESNTNFTHYKTLFKTPGSELYYSFDYGHAHFVMMDSEAFVGRFHTERMLNEHLKWLQHDLEEN